MKKIIILSMAIVFIATFAQAQTDSLKNKQNSYLSKQLNITDSLAKQVESIMATYKTDAGKLMDSKKLDPTEMRAKMDALIVEKNLKLKKILTAEQLNKLLPTTEKKKD
ncbi:hypothetical protein [Pedobacter alpinus]|uniref:LTXXQ motif family protein n=1 Tax=Pedobacter alpinus TaxID=1590643 RepID=A0ABW5TRL1_9SPHI